MSDIKFKATVDSKKGEVSLKELDKGVGKIEKSTKKAGAGFKQLAVGVAAGVAAFAVASRALRGLVRWMGDAVDKAAAQQLAEKEVASALESTGREVEANAEHFKEYASQIQEATTCGDEQVLAAQALLIQLTNLRTEGIDKATKGAVGLATVYKTDLKAATALVGKALAGNYGALSRYGISVTHLTTEEEKRAYILEQLLVMYERAKAETDTYQGAVKQLSNIYGDLKEEVGKAVTENEQFRDTLKQITELTKELIASGLVEWVTDIAVQAVKSLPMLKSLSESLAMIILIFKLQAEEQKMASETTQEWIKHLQLNDELQQKLRKDIAAVIEVTKEQAEATEKVVTGIEKLSMIEIDWEALKPPSVLMEEWDALFALVETPELDLAFEQFAMSAEDNFANVMESMGFFVRDSEELAEKYEEIMGDMTEAQKEFSAIALGELMSMEASLKGMVDAILNTFEKWALGAIVKSTMTLSFPANLIASAVAMAAVKAIFAEIKGMEKGGWVGLQGPEIIKVGERGPEYVTSNRQTTNIYNQSASPSGIQRIVIQNRITIGEQTFYKETVKSVNTAGEKRDIIVPIQVVV